MRSVPSITETIEAGQRVISEARLGHFFEQDTVRAATVVVDYAASIFLKPHESGVRGDGFGAVCDAADAQAVGTPAWLALVLQIALEVLVKFFDEDKP